MRSIWKIRQLIGLFGCRSIRARHILDVEEHSLITVRLEDKIYTWISFCYGLCHHTCGIYHRGSHCYECCLIWLLHPNTPTVYHTRTPTHPHMQKDTYWNIHPQHTLSDELLDTYVVKYQKQSMESSTGNWRENFGEAVGTMCTRGRAQESRLHQTRVQDWLADASSLPKHSPAPPNPPDQLRLLTLKLAPNNATVY